MKGSKDLQVLREGLASDATWLPNPAILTGCPTSAHIHVTNHFPELLLLQPSMLARPRRIAWAGPSGGRCHWPAPPSAAGTGRWPGRPACLPGCCCCQAQCCPAPGACWWPQSGCARTARDPPRPPACHEARLSVPLCWAAKRMVPRQTRAVCRRRRKLFGACRLASNQQSVLNDSQHLYCLLEGSGGCIKPPGCTAPCRHSLLWGAGHTLASSPLIQP